MMIASSVSLPLLLALNIVFWSIFVKFTGTVAFAQATNGGKLLIVIFFEEKKFDAHFYNILQDEIASAFNNTTVSPDVQWLSVIDGQSSQVSFDNEGSIVISATGCTFNRHLLEKLHAAANETNSVINVLISSETCSRPRHTASTLAQFYVLPVYHMASNVVQVFKDLQQTGQLDWGDMIVVLDESADPEFMYSMLEDISYLFSSGGKMVSMELYKIICDKADIHHFALNIFQNIQKRRKLEEKFLFLCNEDNLLPLLKAANETDFLNLNSQFLIVWNQLTRVKGRETIELDDLLKSYTTNIAILRPNFKEIPEDEIYFNHLQMLFRRLVRHAFAAAIPATVINANNSNLDYLTLMKKQNGISQMNIRTFDNNTQKDLVVQLGGELALLTEDINYKWTLESHLADEVTKSYRMKSIQWTLGLGFERHQNISLFPYLTEGLQDMELIVVTLHSPPDQIIEPETCQNASMCKFTGVTFNILEELRKRLKFRYTIKVISLDNASFWDITVAMLKNKEVHFAAIGLVIRAERRKVVDFTIPYFTQSYTILSGRPKKVVNMFMYIMAIKLEVWLVTWAALFLLAFSTYQMQSIHRSMRKEFATNEGHESWTMHFSYKRYCFTLFGIFCQQGMTAWPTSNAIRIALATWLLSSLVITASYSGNIVAFITIPRFQKQIRNLEDLVNSKEATTWGSHRSSPVRFHFNSQNDEIMTTVRDRIEWYDNLNDEALLNRVINENHMIVESRSSIVEELVGINHDVVKIENMVFGDELFFDSGALAACKKFPFLPIINKGLGRLLATGLVDKYHRDGAMNEKKLAIAMSLNEKRSNIIGVSMKNFGGIFLILVFGFTICVIILIFEIAIERLRTRIGIDLSTLVY